MDNVLEIDLFEMNKTTPLEGAVDSSMIVVDNTVGTISTSTSDTVFAEGKLFVYLLLNYMRCSKCVCWHGD